MSPSDVRCVLIKIHGIGNQKRNWSRRFDDLLAAKLAALSPDEQARFVSESVWWADLSRLPGAGVPAAAGLTPVTADVTFTLVQQAYTQYLLAGGATTGATAAFGLPLPNPTKIIAKLKDVVVRAADKANDVADYVTNNGIRLQIQHRLNDTLFQLQAKHPNAKLILGSHSQGTIISYDVLRLNGSQLPRLKNWVTMGSPLGWFLNFLRWGDEPLGMPTTTAWLNFYDDDDKVGKALAGLVNWQAPLPQDINVDNRSKGLDPHDHWHNPDVVERYFQLIKGYVSP